MYSLSASQVPLLSASVGTQTCSSTAAASSALTFMVPSLKPIRFRGVAWLVDVDEVLPKPSCDHRRAAEGDPGHVADGLDCDLRVVSTRLEMG